MPEGDTIFIAASRLRKVLADQTIDSVDVAGRWSDAINPDRIQGQRIVSVAVIGKWLRVEFANDTNLLSHMGMTGSWHIYRHQMRWRKPQHARAIVLNTKAHNIVCFTPKSLQLLSTRQVRQHPQLSQLGPDILAEDFDPCEAAKRIIAQSDKSLAEASLDQRLVAGIGNVYRSESLFIVRLNPFATSNEYSQKIISDWLTQTQSLMRKNLSGARRQTRFRTSGPGKWVYRRNGQHCLICDSQIERRYVGERNRSIYWCPECQAQ